MLRRPEEEAAIWDNGTVLGIVEFPWFQYKSPISGSRHVALT